LRTLDIILGWVLIAFGALHTSLTRKVHPDIDINAVWFASGGLLIIAIGVLNLLRVAYGSVAKGVCVVSVIANLVLLVLMLFIAALLPMGSNPQILVGLILAALLTAFSGLRRGGHAQAHHAPSAK
jgi:Na+/melibiose symporter-like transporter